MNTGRPLQSIFLKKYSICVGGFMSYGFSVLILKYTALPPIVFLDPRSAERARWQEAQHALVS